MNEKEVIAVVRDLLFAAKINSAAAQAGASVRLAKTLDAALSLARVSRPVCVLVDLHLPDEVPWRLAQAFRDDAELRDIPLVGFFSHVQTNLREQAQAAGYAQIWPRSSFFKRWPAILR